MSSGNVQFAGAFDIDWLVSICRVEAECLDLSCVDLKFSVHVDRRDALTGVVKGGTLTEMAALLASVCIPVRMAASGDGLIAGFLGHIFGSCDAADRTKAKSEDDRTVFAVTYEPRQKQGQWFS